MVGVKGGWVEVARGILESEAVLGCVPGGGLSKKASSRGANNGGKKRGGTGAKKAIHLLKKEHRYWNKPRESGSQELIKSRGA